MRMLRMTAYRRLFRHDDSERFEVRVLMYASREELDKITQKLLELNK